MAPTVGWRNLKGLVVRRKTLNHLKSFDPNSLKNLRTDKGKNLLHVAAKRGTFDVCNYLIEIGCEVTAKNGKNGYTPLVYALKRKKKIRKIINLLLKSETDVSWTDKVVGNQSHIIFHEDRSTAWSLCWSLKKREGSSQAATDHLLSKGWTFDNIAYLHDEQFTQCAFDRNVELKSNYEKLKNAIIQQNVEQVERFIEPVSHSKIIMSWAMIEAAKVQSPKSGKIIKMLLIKGAPVDGFPGDEHKSPLISAVRHGNADNCWVLLRHDAKYRMNSLFEYYLTPFGIKNKNSIRDCIRILIENRGVCQNVEFLVNLPGPTVSYCRETIKYTSIARHLSGDLTNKFQNLDSFHYKYYEQCSREVEKIKNHKIDERISVWNLLLRSIDELVPLTKNEILMNEIRSVNFINEFPRFSKTLLFKVNKALEKRLLIDKSIGVLRKCLPLVGSYDLVLEKIVYYINDLYFLNLE